VKKHFLAAVAMMISTIGFASMNALAQDTPASSNNNELLFRTNAPKFHKNFSAGEFDKNGPLVTEDIDVDSNNVKLTGRNNFIDRLKRYSVPFPGLQLRDRILIVDGNKAAVNYVLQGEHKGPYGKIAATGNKIEAMSGEVFEFNDEGLMKKLTTITELDRVDSEVKGTTHIETFENVSLLPVAKANPATVARNRATAAMFDDNFNAGRSSENAKLVTRDVRINADNTLAHGGSALISRLEPLKASFPDMTIRDEYVLADGDRAAVEHIIEGTQTQPFTMPDGSILPPTGKKVRVREIEFMKFNKAGLLSDLVIVHNQHDFATQLNP
jgi:predicted ester cyclase